MTHRDRSDRILIGWDRVSDALADPPRHYVLEYLHDRLEPALAWDFTVALAVWTTDLPSDEVDAQVVQQAKIGIIHVHLLKLQAADLVKSGDDGVSLAEYAETLPPFTLAYRGVVGPVDNEEERREP